jgi:hypothetical protein
MEFITGKVLSRPLFVVFLQDHHSRRSCAAQKEPVPLFVAETKIEDQELHDRRSRNLEDLEPLSLLRIHPRSVSAKSTSLLRSFWQRLESYRYPIATRFGVEGTLRMSIPLKPARLRASLSCEGVRVSPLGVVASNARSRATAGAGETRSSLSISSYSATRHFRPAQSEFV